VGRFRDHSDHRIDPRLAELAARQHGVVSRAQLLELGLGEGAINMRVRNRRLHPLNRGVYAVGHTALAPWARPMAAVLACGQEAVLSHRSAAGLWALLRVARARVDVTVAARSGRSHPGLDVHRVRSLDPRDVTERERIRVTTVPRTLLDLAEVVPQRRLEKAFEEAERLRLLDLRALHETLERAHGRRGLKAIHALLAAAGPVETATRSDLERAFLRLCRTHGIPTPIANATVAGYEVDAHWLTHRRIEREPQRVAATLRELLGA
jgi:predicted transcriptional regulator of viral defense system